MLTQPDHFGIPGLVSSRLVVELVVSIAKPSDSHEESHEPEGYRPIHEIHAFHHAADDGGIGGWSERVDDGCGLEGVGDQGK